MDTQPLLNPKWERYCLERVKGKSQRQAMIAAYPNRKSWTDKSVDNHAYELEKKPAVKRRIQDLKCAAAENAIATRAEILRGMTQTYRTAVKDTDKKINQTTIIAVNNLGKTLLDNIPDAEDTPEVVYTFDFAPLLAPPHLAVHRRIVAEHDGDFVMFGGRASAKSSTVALEFVRLLMQHKDYSGYITMARQNSLRDAVYQKMQWALSTLGVIDQWELRTSPLSMIRKETGQIVLFRGCDKASKSKGAEAPLGTYFALQWFEECDQLKGLDEIRTVKQSLTRNAPDSAKFYSFYTFNPPRSRDCWANKWLDDRRADGKIVYESSYLDMPEEWIPNQFKMDALELKRKNPKAYEHEYLGKPVGYGNAVFENVAVRALTPEERSNIEYHYYGVDWGFSKDPFCWVKVGYNAKTRTLYILDEICSTNLVNTQSAEQVQAKMSVAVVVDDQEIEPAEPYAEVYCDAAEPKSIADFQGMGIRALAAPKQGAHNVRNSIKWLQQRDQIVIDTSCKTAAQEFSNYSYEIAKDGSITSALPDADNHAIDAVRYACATLIANRSYI